LPDFVPDERLNHKRMMNRIAGLALTLLMMVSGACRYDRKPEGVLSETEMITVLMQMYLEEERFSKISVSYDSASRLIPQFREKSFARMGISDSIYRKSMAYYIARPEKLEFIYTALIDSLSLQEQSRPAIPSQYVPNE
jgi:hypothetical protein